MFFRPLALLSLAAAIGADPANCAIVHVNSAPVVLNTVTEVETDNLKLDLNSDGESDFVGVWLFIWASFQPNGSSAWDLATFGETVTSVTTPADESTGWTGFPGSVVFDGGNLFTPFDTIGSVHYLKLAFPISGETHYGWMRMQNVGGEAHFLEWAYNTNPGESIVVGQTVPEPSLVILSFLGIPLFGLLRRR